MRDPSSLTKGMLAGMAGGLAASWVMVQFQNSWSKAAEQFQDGERQAQDGGQSGDVEDATMKAADKLAHLAGRSLNQEQKKKAGPVVHYVFGTLMGGLYGAAAEVTHRSGATTAALYGSGLFVAADEVAVPALGLSKPPREVPWSSHAYGWASHVVYGVTAEYVRRGVRRLL